VKACSSKGCDLSDLSLEDLRAACGLGNKANLIEQDAFEFLTLEGSVNSRQHIGGTAPEQVKKAIAAYRKTLG
jgi:argininosuccinate lyase